MSKDQSLSGFPGGYSFVELVVVVGLIAIICAFGMPTFIGYLNAERTKGSARELVALLNQARQLAITRSTSFSVDVQTDPANQLRFCSGTVVPCPAPNVWLGPETRANGWMALSNNGRITLGPPITFSSLGAANPAGAIRVQNAQGTSSLDVVVSASGRIRICAPGAACAYDLKGWTNDAIAEYRKVLEREPGNSLAQNNLRVLYDQKGLSGEAIREFEQSLQREPTNASATKNLETAKRNRGIVQERDAQVTTAMKGFEARSNDPRPAYDIARTRRWSV